MLHLGLNFLSATDRFIVEIGSKSTVVTRYRCRAAAPGSEVRIGSSDANNGGRICKVKRFIRHENYNS